MPPDGNDATTWAERLYDASAAELLLYGRALGLGHAEAQDVLHDAFRALLALDSPPREPRFYLVRTFRNRALNHRRTLWRRLRRELESKHWFEPNPEATDAELAAVRALAELPVDQREVIVLKLWNSLTFDAIGDLLGISPNTAAGRYRYGLQKLRDSFHLQPDHERLSRSSGETAWLPSAPALPEH